jgi:uncharacterized protein YcfJ
MEIRMKPTLKYVLIGAAAIAVIAGTAIGSSYYTSSSMEPQPQVAQVPPPQQMAQAQPVHHRAPACNDHNVVGTVAGAVGGGLVGSAFGHGGGRTLTTIGGAAAGGALGNAYIPTRGAACN